MKRLLPSLFLTLSLTHAQDLPPDATLATLVAEFDEIRAEVMTPVTELQNLYAGNLEKLKAEVTQAGKLDQVLAVKTELDGFRSGDTPPATDAFPELQRYQSIYRTALQGRLEQVQETLARLTEAHRARLAALQIRLTQQEKLAEAIAVKDAIDALSKAATVASVPAVASAQPIQTPGAEPLGDLLFKQGRLHLKKGSTPGTPDLDISAAEGITDFVDVQGTGQGWAALRRDGTVVGKYQKKPPYSVPGIAKLLPDGGGPQHAITVAGVIVRLDTQQIVFDPGTGPKAIDGKLRGGYHHLVLLEDGTIKAWGELYDGRPDNPKNKFPAIPDAMQKGISQIGAGRYGVWVLTRTGDLLGWGTSERLDEKTPRGLFPVTKLWTSDWTSFVQVKGDTVFRVNRPSGNAVEIRELPFSPTVVRCASAGVLGLDGKKWQVMDAAPAFATTGLERDLEKLDATMLPLLWLSTDDKKNHAILFWLADD